MSLGESLKSAAFATIILHESKGAGSPEHVESGYAKKLFTTDKKDDIELAGVFRTALKDASNDPFSVTFCQSISGLGMTRKVESVYSGGEADFQYNLPGTVSYAPVTLEHVMTKNLFFMKWLTSGLNYGSILRVNMEIKIGSNATTPFRTLILEEAFPISWNMSPLNAGKSEIILETVKVVYSRLGFDK